MGGAGQVGRQHERAPVEAVHQDAGEVPSSKLAAICAEERAARTAREPVSRNSRTMSATQCRVSPKAETTWLSQRGR